LGAQGKALGDAVSELKVAGIVRICNIANASFSRIQQLGVFRLNGYRDRVPSSTKSTAAGH
jgi:hypothetical protein